MRDIENELRKIHIEPTQDEEQTLKALLSQKDIDAILLHNADSGIKFLNKKLSKQTQPRAPHLLSIISICAVLYILYYMPALTDHGYREVMSGIVGIAFLGWYLSYYKSSAVRYFQNLAGFHFYMVISLQRLSDDLFEKFQSQKRQTREWYLRHGNLVEKQKLEIGEVGHGRPAANDATTDDGPTAT